MKPTLPASVSPTLTKPPSNRLGPQAGKSLLIPHEWARGARNRFARFRVKWGKMLHRLDPRRLRRRHDAPAAIPQDEEVPLGYC